MPSQFYSGGGLRITPVIQRVDPDPVEQAIRQQQLYNLQQDPKFQERRLTLEQLGLQQTQSNHEAMQRLQEAGLLEQVRHNTAGEKVDTGRLGETTRSNLATEALHQRGQDLDVASRTDTNKTSVITALIHTLTADYTDKNAKPLLAETLAKLGYPQLRDSLPKPEQFADEKMAAAAMKLLEKRMGGETATPTPSATPGLLKYYK